MYFSDLSLRKTSEHFCHLLKRIIFQYGIGFNAKSQQGYGRREEEKVSEFIVDETLIKVGRELVWLWIAIEPIEKVILDIRISFERSMYLLLNGSSRVD